jgi:hypothetical protein
LDQVETRDSDKTGYYYRFLPPDSEQPEQYYRFRPLDSEQPGYYGRFFLWAAKCHT